MLAILSCATASASFSSSRREAGLNPAVVETFNNRIRAWWLMCTVLAAAFFLGSWSTPTTVVLFGLISFWALREFITLTPTRLGDHRTLFWVFFLFTPLQYVLVGMNEYDLYSILIPVYAFLFIPARIALSGDYKRFLERTAKIQAGLDGLRVLPQPCPGVLFLKLPCTSGRRQCQAVVLLCAGGRSQRRVSVRLGPAGRAQRDRPGDQPQQDLGRLRRRSWRAPRCWARRCGGPRRSSPGTRPACRW